MCDALCFLDKPKASAEDPADKIMPIMPPPLPPPSKPAGDGALADSEGESSEHDGLSKRRRLETVTLTLEPEALSQLQP